MFHHENQIRVDGGRKRITRKVEFYVEWLVNKSNKVSSSTAPKKRGKSGNSTATKWKKLWPSAWWNLPRFTKCRSESINFQEDLLALKSQNYVHATILWKFLVHLANSEWKSFRRKHFMTQNYEIFRSSVRSFQFYFKYVPSRLSSHIELHHVLSHRTKYKKKEKTNIGKWCY